jgi:hypothetical protein
MPPLATVRAGKTRNKINAAPPKKQTAFSFCVCFFPPPYRFALTRVAECGVIYLAVSPPRAFCFFSPEPFFPLFCFGPCSTSPANMREIVHLQAGQCGNQIGAKVRISARACV